VTKAAPDYRLWFQVGDVISIRNLDVPEWARGRLTVVKVDPAYADVVAADGRKLRIANGGVIEL
jgi:hypothetical protein